MKIRFQCDACGKVLKARPEHVGRRGACTRCGAPIVVPEPPEAAPPPSPAPEFGEQPPTETERPEPPLTFKRRRLEGDDLDMTPMVDVVFLLLIFFMITAAFSLQKAIAVPTPESNEGASRSRTLEEIETEGDFAIVRVDEESQIWVDDVWAPSAQDLLAKLRNVRESDGVNQMLVMASDEATTESVVMALDAGTAVGMEEVRLAAAEDDL